MVTELLMDQMKRYPGLMAEDMLKALYQSEFGCAHFALDAQQGLDRLLQELGSLPTAQINGALIEPVGDLFCRVHLAELNANGLNPTTLFRLFLLSSRFNPGSKSGFISKLACFQQLCDDSTLPFDPSYVQRLIADNKRSGFPAIHHSPEFRKRYHPAYRVIRADYAMLLPLLCRIDQLLSEKKSVIMAIEGNSAAGKTTLAAFLEQVYGGNVFHMDDFFLRPFQRTEDRLSAPGGNVDHERFLNEVLNPLTKGESLSFRPYDCKAQAFGNPIASAPKPLNIVEGAYSMHPALSGLYDISMFLKLDFASQKERILNRNGSEMQKRFIQEWIPMENHYFELLQIPKQCDFILDGSDILINGV